MRQILKLESQPPNFNTVKITRFTKGNFVITVENLFYVFLFLFFSFTYM